MLKYKLVKRKDMTKGAENLDDYDAATYMRKPNIQFFPGKRLTDMKETDIKYERYTPPSNG